jgi:hypothetical protein
MSICYGPDNISLAIAFVVSAVIPTLVVYFIQKKWKPASKTYLILGLSILFCILALVIWFGLVRLFTPSCGPGIACIPFEFYRENGTCKYGKQLINNTNECNNLQNQYDKQIQSRNKECQEGTLMRLY